MLVDGHTTEHCADMGVPLLRLTQVQLAQLHFRLSQVYKDSIPAILLDITMSCFSGLPPQAMERKMKQAKAHLDPQRGLHTRAASAKLRPGPPAPC